MQLQHLSNKIYEIRDHQVMFDFDLATLYETETKYLKRAVKASIRRFPPDFMFELTKEEWDLLRCNFSTLETGRGKYPKYLPYVFTEQGVSMLSSVLSSDKAIEVNIAIMRAFVFLRKYAFSHKDLSQKLHELEARYNQHFNTAFEAIDYLMKKDKQQDEQQNRKRIGYK